MFVCVCVCVCVLSHVQLFAAPCTVAHQAPLSMEFSRQEYWSRLPFPTPGDLPDPGIKPLSPAFPALAGRFFTTSATWEVPHSSLCFTRFSVQLSSSVVSDSFVTPWTVLCQAFLSMEFSRQEYWSGLPFPSPGDLPDPGIKPLSPVSPALKADS